MSRVLCLDVGSHRIGVAISDPLRLTAQPHDVVLRRTDRAALDAIAALLSRYEIDTVVVGLPLTLAGREGSAVRRTRRFLDVLRPILGERPLVEWDERLTTAAAERALMEANMKAPERRHVVDSVAASLILQGYLATGG